MVIGLSPRRSDDVHTREGAPKIAAPASFRLALLRGRPKISPQSKPSQDAYRSPLEVLMVLSPMKSLRFLLALALASSPALGQTGSISGKVIDSVTKAGIANARVQTA